MKSALPDSGRDLFGVEHLVNHAVDLGGILESGCDVLMPELGILHQNCRFTLPCPELVEDDVNREEMAFQNGVSLVLVGYGCGSLLVGCTYTARWPRSNDWDVRCS
jgi:hypothetical protein